MTASGIITYSMWRYGMRTVGAASAPKTIESTRARNQAVTSVPSREKSIALRPAAA